MCFISVMAELSYTTVEIDDEKLEISYTRISRIMYDYYWSLITNF